MTLLAGFQALLQRYSGQERTLQPVRDKGSHPLFGVMFLLRQHKTDLFDATTMVRLLDHSKLPAAQRDVLERRLKGVP